MITLSPENSESITKLAALIGWTADQLANDLLAETLEMFADRNSVALEEYLATIHYPDGASAQRALDCVKQMTRASFGGRLPDSFRSEIAEHLDGTFNFRFEYIDRHGEFQQVG